MRFDPEHELPLTEAYPAFARRQQYFDDDRFLRFLIYMIAPDSPHWDERDWELRIDLSLEMMGEDRDGALYQRYERYELDVQEQVFQLFIMYGDTRYEHWLSMRRSFAISMAQLRDPYSMKATDRDRIEKGTDERVNRLLTLEADLFQDKDHLRAMVNQSAMNMSLSGFPEQNALELERDG